MNKQTEISIEELAQPLTYGVDAFLSKEYFEREKKLLWPKVWQMAGRVEELPNVGDYLTYNICDDSIIVIRTAPDKLKAFHNVCPHRGRQLIDAPTECNQAQGNKKNFVCGFHGWTFDLDGNNIFVLDEDDWKGKLNPERTALSPVKVDTWGGWIFVNMDPNCETLLEFLGDAARILNPFELDKMRFKWRNWVIFDCNWKTGLEAFMEPYHVTGTHTQLLKYGEYYAYSAAYGMHGVSGFDTRNKDVGATGGTSNTRAGKGPDARISTYELARENYDTINGASTTQTLVNAAKRLVDELPAGTSTGDVIKHWLDSARRDDAARGVVWPTIAPAEMAEAGLAWHIFPNMSVLQAPTCALCYRVRPFGEDVNKCLFEAYALERFPLGEEPKTQWTQADPTPDKWGPVLCQDFSNMAAVQRGMKSRGFRGTLPNPHQERKVTNFHRNLSRFMDMGYPRVLK